MNNLLHLVMLRYLLRFSQYLQFPIKIPLLIFRPAQSATQRQTLTPVLSWPLWCALNQIPLTKDFTLCQEIMEPVLAVSHCLRLKEIVLTDFRQLALVAVFSTCVKTAPSLGQVQGKVLYCVDCGELVLEELGLLLLLLLS